jgi:hypothetical protein
MWPRPWTITIPAAIIVVPAAFCGLFGRIRSGATVGFVGAGLYVLQTLAFGFPSDYDRSTNSDAFAFIGFVALGMGLTTFFIANVRSDSFHRGMGEKAVGWALAILALMVLVCLALPTVY